MTRSACAGVSLVMMGSPAADVLAELVRHRDVVVGRVQQWAEADAGRAQVERHELGIDERRQVDAITDAQFDGAGQQLGGDGVGPRDDREVDPGQLRHCLDDRPDAAGAVDAAAVHQQRDVLGQPKVLAQTSDLGVRGRLDRRVEDDVGQAGQLVVALQPAGQRLGHRDDAVGVADELALEIGVGRDTARSDHRHARDVLVGVVDDLDRPPVQGRPVRRARRDAEHEHVVHVDDFDQRRSSSGPSVSSWSTSSGITRRQRAEGR